MDAKELDVATVLKHKVATITLIRMYVLGPTAPYLGHGASVTP